MSLQIKVDIVPCTELRESAEKMIQMANVLGARVCGEFNGVEIYATPDTNLDFILGRYYGLLHNQNKPEPKDIWVNEPVHNGDYVCLTEAEAISAAQMFGKHKRTAVHYREVIE